MSEFWPAAPALEKQHVFSTSPCPLCHRERPDDVAHVCPPVVNDSRSTYYTVGNIEAIDIAEYLPFNLGNVVKYVVRAGRKAGADEIHDLNKAVWYLRREIERRTRTK
jgi:hypothetical protein